MKKHRILFLAGNPLGVDRSSLDREARAIQLELERAGHRDCFELTTRWAVEPLDLLHELRKLKPTIVHFSGRGVSELSGSFSPQHIANNNAGHDPPNGLRFQGPDGRAQVVPPDDLAEAFGAAGSSVRVVVLSACYLQTQAEALLSQVDCVIELSDSICDDAARSFAIGFYGGLGERESVLAAHKQGCVAIRLRGLRDAERPQLGVRPGLDADRIVLAGAC